MTLRVKDFIYLDVECLYSLYSQVFEGVADRYLQSYVDAMQETESGKRALLKGASPELAVFEVSRRTENRFLYDHMYSQLEDRLGAAVVDVGDQELTDGAQAICSAFIVRVRGQASIEDYTHLKEFMGQFNELGGALHYLSSYARTPSGGSEAQPEGTLETRPPQNPKGRARGTKAHGSRHQGVVGDTAARRSASAAGLHIDERFLDNLCMLTDAFYHERLDVVLTPSGRGSPLAFRAVLDGQWLRQSPSRLLALYAGRAVGWTLVGRVTSAPDDSGAHPPKSSPVEATGVSATSGPDVQAVGMREAFGAILAKYYDVERKFTHSVGMGEVIVAPLAIYREYSLPNHQSTQSGRQDAPS